MMIAFWLVRSTKSVARTSVSGRSDRSVLARHDLVDDDRDRVRQLIADTFKRRLSNQFGDPDVSSGSSVTWSAGKNASPSGKQRNQQVGEQVTCSPVTADTGITSAHSNPYLLASAATPARWAASWSGFTRSVLVTTATLGARFELGCLSGDEPVPRSDTLVRRQRDGDHVDIGQRVANLVVESLTQQGAGLVQPRRVDEDELAIGAMDDSADRRAAWSAADSR